MKQNRYIKYIKFRGRHIDPGNPVKIRSRIPKDPFPQIRPIQGIMPDSKEEFWVMLALERLKLDYIFQYPVMGGRSSGGQVVDFWVYTVPKPTPILVQGIYWHYTAPKRYNSLLAIAKLEDYFRGKINEVIEVFDTEMPTPDLAYQVVRRKLRL